MHFYIFFYYKNALHILIFIEDYVEIIVVKTINTKKVILYFFNSIHIYNIIINKQKCVLI